MAISAGIGAIVGGFSYVASEIASFVLTGGKWSWSLGEALGCVLGGAIGGVLTYIFPASGIASVLIGGITAFATNALSMSFQNELEGTNYSIKEILWSSVICLGAGMVFTGIFNSIKIPKLNAGRNSCSAISKQIFTKFQRDIIRKISFKTFEKMLTVQLASSALGIIASGVDDAFNIIDLLIEFLGGGSNGKEIFEN